MNLVLSDCEETRITKQSFNALNKDKPIKGKKNNTNTNLTTEELREASIKEEKRKLGLVILRGENVISVVVESAPNLNTLRPQLRLNKGKKGTASAVTKGTIKNLAQSQSQGGQQSVVSQSQSQSQGGNVGEAGRGGLIGGPSRGRGGISKPPARRGGFRRN
ncbi:unnamed protein product [Ambrosiozyma monospora]|uniref:Sm protein B n=1 Tax=Ambrosiozyma monospora TaxID=43982 RepID=A0A9W6YVH3_AMBMO|nr:unnamed protein product [Ambrosiozyma monospora]